MIMAERKNNVIKFSKSNFHRKKYLIITGIVLVILLENCGVFEALMDDGHGRHIASGWAILPERKESADAVILAYDDINGEEIAFAIAEVGDKRKRIGSALNDPAYKRSGWKKEFQKELLPCNAKNISAWVFDTSTYKAFKLQNSQHAK